MVVMILKYVQHLEIIDKLLVPHREFLDEYYKQKKFICSGGQKPRTGGLIIANVDSVDEARAIAQKDPFFINKAAEYEFIEFVPGKYDERFSCFLKP